MTFASYYCPWCNGFVFYGVCENQSCIKVKAEKIKAIQEASREKLLKDPYDGPYFPYGGGRE